jgi:outer membrane protein
MQQRKEFLTKALVHGLVLFFALFTGQRGWSAEQAAASAGPPAGQATQGDKVLTLNEAVRLARENHPRIKAAGQRVGAQEAVVRQELGAYYPTISMEGSYRNTLSSGTVTTSQRSFDFLSGRTNFDMVLYNFGKREGTVGSARSDVDASLNDLRTAEDEIILAVREAYFGYLAAQALVKVREETVKDRELLVRRAQGFYEVGTRPKIDVARAESNLFNARADLIAAQNGVRVAWATLKNAMGAPDFPETPLADERAIAAVTTTLPQAKQAAFSTRPELKGFEAQRKAQDQRIAVSRRNHLPDVLLHADYGRQNANRDNPILPLQPVWTVQLRLNIPIFDGFRTTHKIEEELRNYYSVRAKEEEKKQQIALEVEESYLKLIETGERIKANEAAVRAAKENLDLANGRYQVGVGSIIEITEAQTLYTDAQTNYIRAVYDHKIAEARLQKAIGSP